MANRIMLNQTSYHGAGAIQEIVNEAKAHGFKKAFVCSDPDLVKFNVTSKVTDLLKENGLDYELYSDIKPNPTIENVQHGVQSFKESGADYLIAIGGGSSMDTSKAIGIIIANPEFEDVRSLEGVAPTKKPCVPIIAVPTTAGTAADPWYPPRYARTSGKACHTGFQAHAYRTVSSAAPASARPAHPAAPGQ